MSTSNNQTSLNKDNDTSELPVPVAAIVSLSVGGYVIIVITFLIIRRILVSKGSCQSHCCCPENGICASTCRKINEACPSCCCCSSAEECLSAICCTQMDLCCGDIICRSCKCTGGCSDSHYCSCHSVKCCLGEPLCPSCFDDIDPNACGFLCLEIKVRTTQRSSVRRSKSAPPKGIQNQQFSSHEPPDKIGIVKNENIYQASNNSDITNKNFGKYQVEDSNIQDRQRSSSQKPTRSVSRYHQMPSDRPISVNAQDRHSRSNNKNNTHVNFQEALESIDNNGNPYELPILCSTVLSSSLSGDSSKDILSKSLLNKATNTGSDMETSARSTSRSRRTIRPGQKSQRFPNKILVSSESLKFSTESTITPASEISFILSSDKSLSDVSTHFETINSCRPLPPRRKTMKSLTD